MSIGVGDRAPGFTATALVDDHERTISLADFADAWLVLYFYVKDDTAVCASEHAGFRARRADFEALQAQLLCASVDTIDSHRAWKSKGLGSLPYPWIADADKALAARYGVLQQDTGLALRATFLISPDGVVRHLAVNDLAVGRNIEEILRTLKALQTGRPTPCNWRAGEPTL